MNEIRTAPATHEVKRIQDKHLRFTLARLMIAIAVFAFGFLILRTSRTHALGVSLLVWWTALFPLVFCHGGAQGVAWEGSVSNLIG
jgi:hypothetical protein